VAGASLDQLSSETDNSGNDFSSIPLRHQDVIIGMVITFVQYSFMTSLFHTSKIPIDENTILGQYVFDLGSFKSYSP
jgi:hypothetical protein